MKTTTTAMLGLMTALLALAPPVAADDSEPEEETIGQCLPVWIDDQGSPRVDPNCIPLDAQDGPA